LKASVICERKHLSDRLLHQWFARAPTLPKIRAWGFFLEKGHVTEGTCVPDPGKRRYAPARRIPLNRSCAAMVSES
jgi:hypothetical protein